MKFAHTLSVFFNTQVFEYLSNQKIAFLFSAFNLRSHHVEILEILSNVEVLPPNSSPKQTGKEPVVLAMLERLV